MVGPQRRYMDLFLEESRELLRQGEKCLLAQEKAPDLGNAAPLTRMWHSLKGMASALDLEELVAVAHAAEEGLPTPSMSQDQRHNAMDKQAEAMRMAADILSGLEPGRPGAVPIIDLHETASPSRQGDAEVHRRDQEVSAPALPDTLRVPDRELNALLADVVSLGELLSAGDIPAGSTNPDERRHSTTRNLACLRHRLARLRHLPFATIVPSLESLVLTTARHLGSRARLEVRGADHHLERGTLELLAEVLPHLLRNALAHGIEPQAARRQAGKPEIGLIELRIEPRRGRVRVVVEDDGRGINLGAAQAAGPEAAGVAETLLVADADLTPLLCQAGFSTARVTDVVAGRGIGLAAVQERLVLAGGGLSIHRRQQSGTRVVLEIPETLAVTTCLVARTGNTYVGFPLPGIRGLDAFPASATVSNGPLERLLAGRSNPGPLADGLELTLRGQGGQSYNLQVDQIMGRLEAVVRPLPGLKAGSAILGSTVWKAEFPVLILDPAILSLHLPRPWAGDQDDSAGSPMTGVSPAAG